MNMQTIKEIVIMLGIILLIPVAIRYGVEIYSPMPDYKYVLEKKESERGVAQKEYDETLQNYQFNYSIANLIIGLLLIIIGNCIHVGYVGIALIASGIFCMMSGSYTYWHKFGAIIKFSVIVSTILILIFIAYQLGRLTKK